VTTHTPMRSNQCRSFNNYLNDHNKKHSAIVLTYMPQVFCIRGCVMFIILLILSTVHTTKSHCSNVSNTASTDAKCERSATDQQPSLSTRTMENTIPHNTLEEQTTEVQLQINETWIDSTWETINPPETDKQTASWYTPLIEVWNQLNMDTSITYLTGLLLIYQVIGFISVMPVYTRRLSDYVTSYSRQPVPYCVDVANTHIVDTNRELPRSFTEVCLDENGMPVALYIQHYRHSYLPK